MNDAAHNHHSQPWRAHDELPEAVVGYGTAEIAYILSCHTGTQIEQTRTALAYDRDQINDDIITAGASSLLARGQAHITGETVELTGPASLLEYIAAAATRWNHIGLHEADGTGIDALVHIQTPQTAVLMQPRALGTWWAIFARTEATPASLITELLHHHVATHPDGVMFIATGTLHTSDNMFIRAHQDQWELAHTLDHQPPAPTIILTPSELTHRINTALEV